MENADLRVLVIDASQEPGPESRSLWESLRGEATIVALNKADLPRRVPEDFVRELEAAAAEVVETHACAADGASTLEEALRRCAGGTESGSAGISRARHRASLERVLEPLAKAKLAVSRQDSWEIAAFELRCALAELSSITEALGQEEVLDRIFSEMKSAWLRLPFESGGPARGYLAAGFVPVPHRFRTGETGASWYSGPLAPALRDPVPAKALTFPAASADHLLWYDESLGMLNITYAAAWELGRALALQNRRIRELLQNWRRQQIRRQHAREAAQADSSCRHLPQVQRACPGAPLDPPAELTAWIDGLRRLEGVPVKYLAPDERMLSRESIGFFGVDPKWIDALLDGALSVGRAPTIHDPGCREAEQALLRSSPAYSVTGFLLRSKAVAGWPGLTVDAVGADLQARKNQPLELYRMERLSPSILLCLFKGRVTSVTVRQPAETLHLALKTPADAPALWVAGRKIWKDETLRVLDLTALTDSSGAGFAQHFLHQQQKLEASVQWS